MSRQPYTYPPNGRQNECVHESWEAASARLVQSGEWAHPSQNELDNASKGLIGKRICIKGYGVGSVRQFSKSSGWANRGEMDRALDFQVWCGPAIGSFNDFIRGTYLDPTVAKAYHDVYEANMQLLRGACVLRRIEQLKAHTGVRDAVDAITGHRMKTGLRRVPRVDRATPLVVAAVPAVRRRRQDAVVDVEHLQ